MKKDVKERLKDLRDFLESFGQHDMDEFVETVKEAISELRDNEEREEYKHEYRF